MTTGNETPFVSVREAVRITGLSERYLRGRIRDREIPFIAIGKSFKICLPAFLEQLEREARMNGGGSDYGKV